MKTIIFRSSYWDALSLLEPEQRLEAYDSIMSYAFTGKFKKPSKEVVPVFSLICSSIDFDYSKYETARKERGQEDG